MNNTRNDWKVFQMHPKMVQTLYLLGVSFILTSILYFFASNWQYFNRITKVLLAILLLLLFYTAHFILKRWAAWQPFLSNWTLIAAGIVFGLSLALVGQVYNSHADNYVLFIIWLIPIFLLGVMTKYVPFYVLSYLLSQLAMLLFVFPTSYIPEWQINEMLLMLIGIIIFNSCLFILAYKDVIRSKTILYLTYIMGFSISFYIAINPFFPFHIGLNILFGLILVITIFYWFKINPQKVLLTISITFLTIYTLYRIFFWILEHYGEFMLYILLFIAVALTFLGGIVVGILNKNKMNHYFVQALTICITIVTTLFAITAIGGLFFILFPEMNLLVLYLFALIALILPGLFLKIPEQFRYSMLGTGSLLAFFSGLMDMSIFYHILLLLPLLIGIYMIQHPGVRVLTYLFTNIVLAYILIDLFSVHVMFLTLFLVNTVYYLMVIKEKSVSYIAFLIAAFSFLSLTFIDISISLQIVYNVTFLIGVPLLLFVWYKNDNKMEPVTMLIFWFIFLGAKYYDYLWTLLHKSIVALVIGVIFIGVGYLFDRPNKTIAPIGSNVTYRKSLLIILIVLQVSFIGIQTFTNEKMLYEGDRIKLALEPVDPRSILQGDYIQLNYEINQLDEDLDKGKVKIVLRETNKEYYYSGFYKQNNKWNKDYHKEPGDIIMNGKVQGYGQVQYGIESYFIPEDTGSKLEQKAEYAYVRVSKSGDAIVEKVE